MRNVILVTAFVVAAAFAASSAQAAELNFGGFGQFWYLYNDYGTYDATAKAFKQNSDSQFVLKRARIKATAELTNIVTFFGQVDFMGGPTADAKNAGAIPSPVLLDFWTNLKVHKFFELRAGQLLIPFGYEAGRSPYDLEVLTYSMIYGAGKKYAGSQLGYFPYLRDLGVYFHGDVHGFTYKLGVVNGNETANGAAQSFLKAGDSITKGGNKYKDIVGRLGYHAKMLNGGVSFYQGWDGASDDYDKVYKKMRVGADIKFDYKGALAAAEFIYGATEAITKQVGATATITPLKSWGGYLTGGYTIKEKVQPVLRAEYFTWEKPNATTPDTMDSAGIFGLAAAVNYHFSKNAKVTLQYERLFPNTEAEALYVSKNATDKTKPDQAIVEDQVLLQLGVNY
jgi:hypothetical protein